MTAAGIVDEILEENALVFGSLPPGGRDLDLLVRSSGLDALRTGLRARDAWPRDDSWALATECRIDVVDVVPAGSWGLPADQVQALFERVRPIDGYRRLVRPHPADALLILARRLGSSPKLDPKKRRRVDELVSEEPDAWNEAASRAGAWGVTLELESLARAYRGEQAGSTSSVRRFTRRLRNRGPLVIALSGIDGSGKSSQAAHLRDALEAMGAEAVVEWTRLPYNPSLEVIGAPIKAIIRPLLRRSKRAATPAPTPVGTTPEDQAVSDFRRSSPLLTYLWTIIVACANGLAHRRSTLRHTRRGKAVVRDRYVLDSAVNLRYRYDPSRRFRLQISLIRWLSPRPDLAFWLDVPPEVARERKMDKYDETHLAQFRALYEEEHARLPVVRLDGRSSQEELFAHMARAIWERL